MEHFHVKTKNGRPYLYVREIARVDGKPKVISQIYIGGPDRVAEMARGPVESEPKQLKVEEFGALWLAMQADQDIDLAGIVDGVVERDKREKGPSVGEYFLYAALNRMVKAVSKKAMAGWYGKTSVQQIRPVDVAALTSQRYWEKWDRVSERALESAARQFFARVWELESPSADCLLFDTTNTYTFMASKTDSELERRGKNKHGRDNLRQIGLGLLVARDSRLPKAGTLLTREFKGNVHVVKVLDEGFEYEGQRYKSLSKTVTEIAGTRWSGFTFFALDREARVG